MANLRSALRAPTAVLRSQTALASLALALICLTPARSFALTRAHLGLIIQTSAQQPPAKPKTAKPTTATPASGKPAVPPVGKPAATPRPSQGACTPVSGKMPMELALRHFVKASVPLPRRFLIAAGTDSALSDTDMKALVAEFGPTYYYAGSEASKAKLRDKLNSLGPWPVMLVVKRSDKKIGTTSEIIRLGGHYVTGEFDGRKAISREYTLTCGVEGWIVKDVKEEKGA